MDGGGGVGGVGVATLIKGVLDIDISDIFLEKQQMLGPSLHSKKTESTYQYNPPGEDLQSKYGKDQPAQSQPDICIQKPYPDIKGNPPYNF